MTYSDVVLNKDVIGGIVKVNVTLLWNSFNLTRLFQINEDRGSSYFKLYQKTNVNMNSMKMIIPMNNSFQLEDYYKNYKTLKSKDSCFKENNDVTQVRLYKENNNPIFKHAKTVQG